MPIPITIPPLGWSTDEAIFSGWLKPDGSEIQPGDALFTLESEKATQDIEAIDAGTLRIPAHGPKANDRLTVGAVIGYLLAKGEAAPSEPGVSAVRAVGAQRSITVAEAVQAPGHDRREGPAISPRARRVADTMGIDWTKLRGGGTSGRIRERDVRAPVTAGPAAKMMDVTPLRRTIAVKMMESHQSTAPVTLTTTVEASNLVNLRRQFKEAAPAEGVPSYTDFIVKLAALTLAEHPHLNARWQGERIGLLSEIHIGIAVDTDAGLLVPVVRDVPGLSIRDLAARTRELIERARQRTLSADDLRGGTFTVTNLGAFGIDAFTPVIHFPEAAILGIGRIRQEPVVRGQQVVIHDVVTLSLTFDHRIVDGAPAARFLQRLGERIKNPGAWLLA
jgi:pyruvate dehydrogenase E2 component (dihydrolipoamide acetyltransferase)